MDNPEKLETQGTQEKQNKNNTICVGHHYVRTNTNNVNKTGALLKTIGGKDEPNIVFTRISIYNQVRQKSWQRQRKEKIYVKVKYPLSFEIWIFHNGQPDCDDAFFLQRCLPPKSNVALFEQLLRHQLNSVHKITVLGTHCRITYSPIDPCKNLHFTISLYNIQDKT